MKLKCPLCLSISFASEEALLHSLLSFASTNIACPLCIEVLCGFDKFTIHLCSHILNLKPTDTVNLIHDARANVVSLNEILENIHLNEPTDSSKSNSLKIPTEMANYEVSSGLENSSWSDPRVLTGVSETENQQLDRIPVPLTSMNAYRDSPRTSKGDQVDESKNLSSPCLELNQDFCPQALQNPCESPLALQVSLNNNTSMGSSSLFGDVSDTVTLPAVDDLLRNFEFLFNVDKSTTDLTQPEADSADLKRSQTEIFVTTFTPDEFDLSDPVGVDVNTNWGEPSHSPRQNIRCDICSISFPDVDILNLHEELVHEKNSKSHSPKLRFQCEHCKCKFKLKASLLAHQQVAHAIENGSGSLDANLDGENFQFRCNMCPKAFKKENYLIQHMKRHEEKQWTCDECGKTFATKHFLQNHKRLHTGEMPYICSICNKQFTFQQSFHRHIAYHNSEKPHRCKECGKSFKELSTLYNHQRIHTGEKPFSCDVCGKNFRQRVTSLMHRRIHTNAKEFKCSKCQKSFRYKISLRSHKCIHSAITALTDTTSL